MKGNFIDAFDQFEKGYYLYPSGRMGYLLWASLALRISNSEYKDTGDINLVVKAERYHRFGITNQMIILEFYRITKFQLENKGNIPLYSRSYNCLVRGTKDKDISDEISYAYNYNVGNYYLNLGELKDAVNYYGDAYKIRPGNAEVQRTFIQVLLTDFHGLSTREALSLMETWHSKLPRLDSNMLFTMLKSEIYLSYFGQLYDMKHIDEAEKYKRLFEDLADSNPKLSFESNRIGDAYTSAAVYYYKKGNKKKAKELIQKGLHYSPGNYQLLFRLSSVDQ